ncbi:MAG TPA: helix-turn-helix domain-containing protein [Mariprofundaceae bacterium]|nr:helix-turn-helix domain-containing protein [Mariprofundaceae bacterium]
MTDTTDDQLQKGQEARHENRQALLADIGRRLREARESRQISLDEVARELKLRAVYLAALEQGDWDTLPGDVYGVGFTRQYARFLEIDLEEDIARIKSGKYELTRPLTFPDPPIAPAKRWAVTAALLFMVLLIAFNVFHSANHERKPVPAPAPVTSPPPPAPAPAVSGSVPAPAAISPQPPASTAEPPSPAAPSEAPVPATASGHSYEFYAVGGDVWLQLYRDHGATAAAATPPELVKEALLRDGQHMSIDIDADDLLMDCGNAGALQVTADGKALIAAGQLGPMGKVVRNYRLAPPAP